MRGSEFLSAYARRGLPIWEAAALALASEGELVPWTMVPVPVRSPDGKHEGTIYASSDYLAVGEEGDLLRLPLLPGTAQKIADQYGVLLPTKKMVDAIWQAAPVKLKPIRAWEELGQKNLGANLEQYAAHSRAVDAELAALGPAIRDKLVAGQKKDVIVSTKTPRGMVAIYGWHWPDGHRQQGEFFGHGDQYVDYSHGIRFVAPRMALDGRSVEIAEVLRDPELSSVLSDEGPVPSPRYPVPRLAPGSLASVVSSGAALLFAPRKAFA